MQRRETVLVVDDDQRVRQTFSRNLEMAGYIVLTASGGEEAIEMFEQERPNIILVDVRMPYVDGFDVLKAIRERDSDVEIILVTGHGDMDTSIAALRAGASDFIPKPVDHKTLDVALQRAEERQRLKRDLRSAQQELRASEEYYRGITETAFVGVCITSPDETLTFTNQALAEMLGYSREELVGLSISQLTTPDEFARYQTRTERRRAGMRDQYETVLFHKDGTRLDVLVSAAPLRDAGGEFESTLAVMSDITDRKRAEEALAWEAKVNAAVAELSKALISSVSLEDMSELVLDHAKELTDSTFGFVGYLDEETGFLVSPTLSQDIWAACDVPDKTFIFETFSGLWGWVLDHRAPMMTNDPSNDPRSSGVPEGHIPIRRFLSAPALIDDQLAGQIALANATRDYTENDLDVVQRLASLYAAAIQRRQAEVALTASEERFRQLAENIHEVFWLVNPDNDRILYVSPAYEEIWGVPADDLYANPELWAEAIHPEDRDRVRAVNIEQVEDGYDHEYRIIRPNGVVRWMRARAFPVRDEQGEIYRIAGLSEDITERKRTEEKLRQYAREQSVLYNVTSAVSTELNPDELLSTVLDVVLPAVDSDIGWVSLIGPTLEDPPRIAARRGLPDHFLQAEEAFPLDQCQHCMAAMSGKREITDVIPITGCPRIPFNDLEWAEGKEHLGVPLVAGDEILGILEIAWSEGRSHTEDEKHLLITIGRQVGLALHNAQLYQAARQVDRLRVLNELDRDLAATLDPEKVAEVTLRQIAQAVHASLGMLFLLPIEDFDYPGKIFNLNAGWIEARIPDNGRRYLESIIHELQEKRSLLLLPAEELIDASPQHAHIKGWGDGLAIGIRDNEDLAATLFLARQAGKLPFTDEDQALVQAAATRAGQAIQNAQLYHASQQRGDRLATLNSISSAAVSSLEIEGVLQEVLALTCEALDTIEGSILLKEPETEDLIFTVTLESDTATLRGRRLPKGKGVAGWVAEHGDAVCVNSVTDDPRWYSGIDEKINFETRSLCCAPLRHLGEITGVIQIVNKRNGEFSDEDLSLLESVSSIAAVALQNARLYTATRSRAEELALLNEIGLSLTATLDREAVVESALAQIRLLFHADGVALLQYDDEEDGLTFVRALGAKAPLDASDLVQSRDCIAWWALAERKAVLVEDVQSDDRGPACLEHFLDCETRALMVVPLLTLQHAIGVIEVISRRQAHYTQNDLHTLQAIASTLAVALENAQLYEEVKTLLHERQQAQAQLIHAEKMTALGRLVASIAHEINNPLQSVQGCLTLVEEEMEADRRQEKMERYLNIATVEIDRISTIVRRMRDFYRSPREGRRLVDVHTVLESVLALTGKQLQHSYVEVSRQWVETDHRVEANPDHLKQVFLNLVLNAVDALPDGGTLKIVTALDEMTSEDGKHPIPALRIDFIDDGIGMSQETKSRLFEPFFTTKDHGSGLGLSISYSIIQAHGGSIVVTSEEGHGTTFTLFLPAEDA